MINKKHKKLFEMKHLARQKKKNEMKHLARQERQQRCAQLLLTMVMDAQVSQHKSQSSQKQQSARPTTAAW